MNFAEKLKTWRIARRWPQAAAVEYLSRQLNCTISQRTYEAWEQATIQPRGITRAALERTIEEKP